MICSRAFSYLNDLAQVGLYTFYTHILQIKDLGTVFFNTLSLLNF